MITYKRVEEISTEIKNDLNQFYPVVQSFQKYPRE